jgi:hypothetical protein
LRCGGWRLRCGRWHRGNRLPAVFGGDHRLRGARADHQSGALRRFTLNARIEFAQVCFGDLVTTRD